MKFLKWTHNACCIEVSKHICAAEQRKKSAVHWMYFANANVIIHFFLCFSGLCSLFCKYGNCIAIVLKLEEVIKIHPASTLFFQRYLAQKCKNCFGIFEVTSFQAYHVTFMYSTMAWMRSEILTLVWD